MSCTLRACFLIRVTKMLKNIVFLVCVLMLCACTSVKWAVIQNSTDSSLDVNALFIGEDSRNELDFYIQSGEQTGWIYEQSPFDSSRIDKYLKSIQATSENGCIISFDRDAIEKRIPDKSWALYIEQQDLTDACASQGK